MTDIERFKYDPTIYLSEEKCKKCNKHYGYITLGGNN